MLEHVVEFLNGIPKEFVVMIVAALPISELRGAIPLGALFFKMALLKTYILSVLGNFIPVIPLLLFLSPISCMLRKIAVFDKFFTWFFERTKKRADIVQRYEMLGLILFVAIPLPITGAWTGAVAATLFKLRFRYAIIGLLLGILIAGVVVTLLTKAGIMVSHIK